MPTLVFRSGDGKELKKDLKTELSVGREAGNDVTLDDERLSRRHCRFFVDHDGSVFVEDLGAANGVLVGGVRIGTPVMVEPDVEVKIGGYTVKIASGTALAKPAMKMTRHVALVEAEEVKRKRLSKPSSSDTLPVDAPAVLDVPDAAEPPEPPTLTGQPGPGAVMAVREPQRPAAPLKPSTLVNQPKAARAVAVPADDRPALRGLTSPFDALVFPLEKPKHVIGREPPADFVIADDSISRRHAEIFKIGPRYSLRDLSSANGTFVNDQQVSETTLSPGDILRFGVVEMTFTGPASAVAPNQGFVFDDKKKKLLRVGGIAAGALMLVAVLWAFFSPDPPPPQTAPLPNDAKAEQDLPKLMIRCRALADKDSDVFNCAEAIKVCTLVAGQDATLADARLLANQCKKELANEGVIKDALLRLATSQEEEALALLVKISDKKSAHFARATEVFNDAAELAIKHRRADCKGDVAAGRFEMALPACRRVLELTCNTPEGVDYAAQSWFQQASKQSGKKAEYTCPAAYAVFQSVTAKKKDDPERKLDRAVRIMYSYDSRVADRILDYLHEGRPKHIAGIFKNLSSREPKLRPQLRPIMLQLEVIDGRYTQCQGLLLRGDAKGCDKIWDEAMEAEKKFLPEGYESALAMDLHAQLGRGFFALAKDALAKEHYDQAAESVFRCFKHDPKNTDCTGAIAQMEREADRALREDPGCSSALSSLSITRPESPVHKRAQELADKKHCQ